jgi:hypothetical protein
MSVNIDAPGLAGESVKETGKTASFLLDSLGQAKEEDTQVLVEHKNGSVIQAREGRQAIPLHVTEG